MTIATVIQVSDIRGLPSNADVNAKNPAMMPIAVKMWMAQATRGWADFGWDIRP